MSVIDNPSKRVLGAADFPPLGGDSLWGRPVEVERRRRICLSTWAYAYEIANHSIVSDQEFDRHACLIDRTMTTGHPVLDEFFIAVFSPMTGMWIHQHPELEKVAAVYRRFHEKVRLGR